MADFRMIKTKIWRDKKFKRWDGNTKSLAFYLMTNEAIPPSGIYEIDIDAAKLSVGFNKNVFKGAWDRLREDEFLKWDDSQSVVWIVNYLRHFPSKNQSVMVNVFESLKEINSDLVKEFKVKYENLLTEWEQSVSTLSIERKNSIVKKRRELLTTSPTQEIFNYWDKCYKEATGEKYPFFGERDGKIFKSLAIKYGKEKVSALIGEFFRQADVDPDCWWHDKLDVVIWYRQISKLITQLTRC